MVAERAKGTGGEGAARRASMVESVVLETLLGETLLTALRRLAQEDASARRFATGPSKRSLADEDPVGP